MTSVNHKLAIIDYYDSLIQQVDIYTEEKLKIYSNEHLVEIKEEINEREDSKEFDLETETDLLSEETDKKVFSPDTVKAKPLSDFAIKINWCQQRPFEMKAQDYLNIIRDAMIKQIEIIKIETLDYYEAIKDGLDDEEKLTDEELKKKLFAKRSAFLFSRPHSNLNPFTLYLVISDFYLNELQLKLLEYVFLICFFFVALFFILKIFTFSYNLIFPRILKSNFLKQECSTNVRIFYLSSYVS